VKPYYEDDLVTLYHGDCLELDAWLQADVLVTDPPYGMAYESNRNRLAKRGVAKVGRPVAGDADTSVRDAALAAWGNRPACNAWTSRMSRPSTWETSHDNEREVPGVWVRRSSKRTRFGRTRRMPQLPADNVCRVPWRQPSGNRSGLFVLGSNCGHAPRGRQGDLRRGRNIQRRSQWRGNYSMTFIPKIWTDQIADDARARTLRSIELAERMGDPCGELPQLREFLVSLSIHSRTGDTE
jgi:hypothetical protein